MIRISRNTQQRMLDFAKEGFTDGVRNSIRQGANVNYSDDTFKWTPLHLAASKGYMEVTTVLIEFGAKLNAETRWGATPLHEAAAGGYKDTVEKLLQYGADPTIHDVSGKTPADYCSVPEVENIIRTWRANQEEKQRKEEQRRRDEEQKKKRTRRKKENRRRDKSKRNARKSKTRRRKNKTPISRTRNKRK